MHNLPKLYRFNRYFTYWMIEKNRWLIGTGDWILALIEESIIVEWCRWWRYNRFNYILQYLSWRWYGPSKLSIGLLLLLSIRFCPQRYHFEYFSVDDTMMFEERSSHSAIIDDAIGGGENTRSHARSGNSLFDGWNFFTVLIGSAPVGLIILLCTRYVRTVLTIPTRYDFHSRPPSSFSVLFSSPFGAASLERREVGRLARNFSRRPAEIAVVDPTMMHFGFIVRGCQPKNRST